ncbi:hypothetical protein EJA70_19490 [Pseudomonas sp. PB103]|nr:hypothetical protein EJA70_19490 [Pseudomonas sp. PB103]
MTNEPVGAGLPAIAVGQPTSMLTVPALSLASQLPQGRCESDRDLQQPVFEGEHRHCFRA